MCNHYRADPSKIATWAEYAGYRISAAPEEGEVWPKRAGALVRMIDGVPTLDRMGWGVPLTVPGKRPGTTITKNVTNVRNLSSSFWRSMLKSPAQRCLVPFTEFAEPVIGGGRAEHWFRVLDREVAAFAGIWRMSEAGPVYAFLTTEPNSLVAPLHPKAMPVILPEDRYAEWLSADVADALALVEPFPSQLMAVKSPT